MIPVDPLPPVADTPTPDTAGASPQPDGSTGPAEALVDTGASGTEGVTPAPPGTAAGPGAAADLPAVTRQRDDYYDLLLRKTAEFDNYRKRVERERRELADYVAGELVRELLPAIDDFERALAAPRSGDDAFRQGVELIYRRLLDTLARRGVTVLDPLGQPFDPHVHEAVARVAAQGSQRDGEIVEVFSRGYRLGDRLLRPAMVRVATA